MPVHRAPSAACLSGHRLHDIDDDAGSAPPERAAGTRKAGARVLVCAARFARAVPRGPGRRHACANPGGSAGRGRAAFVFRRRGWRHGSGPTRRARTPDSGKARRRTVTFAQRFALVMLAAYFVSSVVASLAALPFAEALLRRSARRAADSRARGLALFRLLPAFAAMALTLLVLAPGYYAHEQRAELESAGLLLTLCAAGGALILLCAVVRTCRAVTQTAKLRRSWLAKARPLNLPHAGMRAFEIDLAFPLVAVLGAVRPRLFISTTVLRACTEDEIAAIIEHERRHVLSADNIMRVLMDAAPDALALTRLPRRLAEEWHRAV